MTQVSYLVSAFVADGVCFCVFGVFCSLFLLSQYLKLYPPALCLHFRDCILRKSLYHTPAPLSIIGLFLFFIEWCLRQR